MLLAGESQSFDYTGDVQIIELLPGKYNLEVWGAEGGGRRLSGNSDSGLGGLGGYSCGLIEITEITNFYVYVGGYGKSSTSGLASGGWNGGGSGYASARSEPGNGGGGASDIRINSDSLYARVIVAGGGGGGGEDSADSYGHGGGLTGTSSYYPGTQTSAGTGGSFGQGGSTNYGDGGGGGGGWYGGGTTLSSSKGTDTQGGGGGSGYIYTESTSSNYPFGCLLDSQYYLTEASTTSGKNTGNGKAVITCIQVGWVKLSKSIGINTVTSNYDYDTSKDGDTINISATLSPGYHFAYWVNYDNNVCSTNLDYSFTFYENNFYYYKAIAEPNTDTLYTVNHLIMNDDLSTYNLYESQQLTGVTDTEIFPETLNINAYVSPSKQLININGDGSSSIDYLYDRAQYELKISFDTGKDAICSVDGNYIWGEDIEIYVTTLPGYAFDCWRNIEDNSIFAKNAMFAFKMPHNNLSLNADIHPFDVKYTVKHNIEMLDGSFQERDIDELYGVTDTQVIPEAKTYTGFTCTSPLEFININGDESTLVTYYYTRNQYKLTIKYTDDNIIENDYPFEQNINLYFDNNNLNILYRFDHWYTNENDLFIQRPFILDTSFSMPAHDSYIEAIITDNRKNTNIYKNIFPEDVSNIDMVYEYENEMSDYSKVITQISHGFKIRDVLCLIDGVYYKAKAENSPYGIPIGIVSDVIDENKFTLMKTGIMDYPEQSFKDTTILYLTSLIPGRLTHYGNITNNVYIPVAFYINNKIIINIQQGSIGDKMSPYQVYPDLDLEEYTKPELDDCITQAIGGVNID